MFQKWKQFALQLWTLQLQLVSLYYVRPFSVRQCHVSLRYISLFSLASATLKGFHRQHHVESCLNSIFTLYIRHIQQLSDADAVTSFLPSSSFSFCLHPSMSPSSLLFLCCSSHWMNAHSPGEAHFSALRGWNENQCCLYVSHDACLRVSLRFSHKTTTSSSYESTHTHTLMWVVDK